MALAAVTGAESWEEKGEEVMLAPADNKFGPTENQHGAHNLL